MREALHRIQTLIPDMIEQFNHLIKNPKEEWNGSTCKFNFDIKKFPFSGKISGTFSVSESNVVIRGNGPKSLSPLKNLLENAIKTKGKELLS